MEIEESEDIHIMNLYVDLLAASFSRASLGDQLFKCFVGGLVTSIPGIGIFCLGQSMARKSGNPERMARGKRVSWMILAFWFSLGAVAALFYV